MDKPNTSQNSKEFAQLLQLYIDTEPKNVLEIGTHEGGTLYYWLKCAMPGTKVASVDVQRIKPERYSEWADVDVDYNYYTGESQSPEAFSFIKVYLGNIDWLFIDGGHEYWQVEKDWNIYTHLMPKGGIVAFHDICSYPPFSSDVDLFWGKLKRNYNHTEFIERNEEGFLGPGIGVIFL